MVLMNNHKATPMPPSQFHAKPNKEEMLGAFVTIYSYNVNSLKEVARYREVLVKYSITP